MKVLLIASDNHPTSGAFLSMTTLCRLLMREHGVETLVVLPRPGDGEALLRAAGVPFTHIRSYSWVIDGNARGSASLRLQIAVKKALNRLAVLRLRRLIRRMQPDVVHTNTIYTYVGALAAGRERTPHIWHIREQLGVGQGKALWDRSGGERLIAESARVVAVSGCMAAECSHYVPAERLVTVLNGIDETAYAAEREPILAGSTPRLFYGGGYEPQKGFDDLVKALGVLHAEGTAFTLTMLGDVPPDVICLLKEAGIDGQTHMPGCRDDVPKLLRDTDVAFCTSVWEAFGRKTAEGMMAGALVIASDTGGTLDMINDGITGMLYRQGNPESLAQRIREALRDVDASRRIAQSGQEYAHKHLTAARNASQMLSVYQTAIDERKNYHE